jgi:hypothetical protein
VREAVTSSFFFTTISFFKGVFFPAHYHVYPFGVEYGFFRDSPSIILRVIEPSLHALIKCPYKSSVYRSINWPHLAALSWGVGMNKIIDMLRYFVCRVFMASCGARGFPRFDHACGNQR